MNEVYEQHRAMTAAEERIRYVTFLHNTYTPLGKVSLSISLLFFIDTFLLTKKYVFLFLYI